MKMPLMFHEGRAQIDSDLYGFIIKQWVKGGFADPEIRFWDWYTPKNRVDMNFE